MGSKCLMWEKKSWMYIKVSHMMNYLLITSCHREIQLGFSAPLRQGKWKMRESSSTLPYTKIIREYAQDLQVFKPVDYTFLT